MSAATQYEPTIGLEVHAQLSTRTKIFCGCATSFGADPNTHTCPVCLGMPGVLPVLNRQAVEFALRAGLALGCTIRRESIFSRKHYFYPDLPKGYQITQYEEPICEHGQLTLPSGKVIRILRIHLEEDAGKNLHGAGSESLVDLNRAGTPLIEIVSEPDLANAQEASDYLKALRAVVMYLGINDGNLEEGSLRCDANVSVKPLGAAKLGTRAELKNMNSFRFLRAAIEHEIERQSGLLRAGGTVVQETRSYDPQTGVTRSLRVKSDAHDYRYFPEPDLPVLGVDEGWIERVRVQLPELPAARAQRYVGAGVGESEAALLTDERPLADFFDLTAPLVKDQAKLAKRLVNEFQGALHEQALTLAEQRATPRALADLLELVESGALSSSASKEVLGEMVKTGQAPAAIAEAKGLRQVQDEGETLAILDAVLARSAPEVERYRGGKTQLLGFFVGEAMKAMKGKGNPALIGELVKKKLG